MSRKLNIIVVPQDRGTPARFTISVMWLRIGLVALSIFLIAIAFGVGSYSYLMRRSIDYAQIKKENEQLKMENSRIVHVAREVEESRKILAQIIRSLGGHLDLGRPLVEGDSAALSKALQETEINFTTEDLLNRSSYAVDRMLSFGMPSKMPVDGFITQKFHEDHLFPSRSHRGIDIASKTGSNVLAAAAGRVVFEGWTPHYGNCMMIAHPNGYMTFYGHNQMNIKKVRELASRGEPIALLGNSGRSSAPHLHFEIWKDGVPVDPMEFLHVEMENEEGS